MTREPSREMGMAPFDQRPSGIAFAGELPWGSHFCVLYASQRELFDAVVPFISAGLKCNELCSWEVRAPLDVEEVTRALASAVPDLATYTASGQLEIVSTADAPSPPRADEALERRLDQATLAGFDGLRLVRHAGSRGQALDAPETIGRLNVIAAYLYPRAEYGAVGLMQVVQDHRFALVRNSGRWEVLAGSEARTTRDALARSEEKLRSLFGNMSEGFAYHRIVLDARGRPCDYVFLEVNPAFERLTGLVAQEILGKRATRVLPGLEADPADWIGRYGRVALAGESVQFESYAAPLDKWYAVSAFSPHRGYFAVTFADITDRKRAETERRAAEERLLVTLQSIGDAVIATDTQGRVTLMNRVAEDLTGWRETEARGRPLGEVFRVVDEDTGAAAEDPVRKVIEQGCVAGLANHTALIAKGGRRVAIADSAAPVRGGTGLLGVVLVFRDVTATRQAEQERELTIEFLRLVNANRRTDDLIRAAATFFQERSGCEAVGLRLKEGDDYPYYEARGFSLEFLDLESRLCARDGAGDLRRDTDGSPVLECMCGSVIGGRVDPTKPFFTKSGSFWTNCTTDLLASSSEADRLARTRNHCNGEGYQSVALVPMRIGSERLGLLQLNDRRRGRFDVERVALWERLAGYLAVAVAKSRTEEALREEVTEHRRTEEALKRANEGLEEADRRKNEFLAMLSHELRNPLAPISNSLHVLDRAAPGGDQARRAKEIIDRQVAHLSHLVDDLLDVTRVSRNKIQLQRRRLDLCDVVRRSVEDQRSLFERGDVHLESDTSAEPLFVEADATRVAQVVGNLLQNAVKFTQRGGLTRVSVAPDHPREHAVIRVTDDGVGMAPETLAGLFQPFMQADKTLVRSAGGLGLGLALVKGLVELHGGEVSAHSEGLGKGAEFVVRLPLGGAAESRPLTGHASPPRRSRRVLIIEDNVDAAASLRDVLELSGHEVAVAHEGPEGISRARAIKPEVILCDIGLPGMDGYAVARSLRGEAWAAGARLVALSGYTLPEDLRRAAEAGFDAHLAKPPDLEELEKLLGGT